MILSAASVTVRDKVPGAMKLADASAYYPPAAIIGGWAAANDYYEPNKETLAKLIRGWVDTNDYIIANSNEAMEKLQKGHYARRRWPTSMSPSKRRRCSPPATGSAFIQMAQSPTGYSRPPTSSWRTPISRTSLQRASILSLFSRRSPDRPYADGKAGRRSSR